MRVHACVFLKGVKAQGGVGVWGGGEYQVVHLKGKEERVAEGRQKINHKLLYTKDPTRKKIH